MAVQVITSDALCRAGRAWHSRRPPRACHAKESMTFEGKKADVRV